MPSHQDDMQYAELTEIIVKFGARLRPTSVSVPYEQRNSCF